MSDIYTDVKTHYDKLIEEGNDPIYDSDHLKKYMDKWDGLQFIEDMQLSGNETVLEIGIGTGRLAHCAYKTGFLDCLVILKQFELIGE